MKRLIFLLAFSMFFVESTFAQYYSPRSNVWAFGYSAGANFSSGSPVAINTRISTTEGCASIADSRDSLLFYTDGVKVWDKTHTLMLSGGSLSTYLTSSTTQGSLIIPFLNDTNKYYIFSLEYAGATTGWSHLVYSVVDMSLRSGLGDVTSTRGVAMRNRMSEKMTAVAGNNCDIWMVTHILDSPIFLSYHITSSGFDTTPVISRTGRFTRVATPYSIGVIKISPDRSKLVCQSWSSAHGCELFDFDATTGVVSNDRVLDSTNACYGAEFSPNSQMLYSEVYGANIYQYDVTGTTEAAIRATRYSVVTNTTCDLKLASDGKIYTKSPRSASYLAAIDSPNLAGSRCSFHDSVLRLNSGTTAALGLPNNVYYVIGGDTTTRNYSFTSCFDLGDSLALVPDTVGLSYFWSTGETTRSINVGAGGTYWCAVGNGCLIRVDTFFVHAVPFDTTIRVYDTTLCLRLGATLTLNADTVGANYLWSDASTGTSITISTPGTYWTVIANACKRRIDTFNVHQQPYDTSFHRHDTSLCVNLTPLTLSSIAGYTAYSWSTGATSVSINVAATGTYISTAQFGCHIEIDTFNVTVIPLPIVDLGSDVQMCVGDSLVLSTTQPAGYSILWSNSTTGSSMTVNATGTYWVNVQNGCSVTDSIHVLVSPYPVVDLGPDQANCTGTAVTLRSLVTYTAPTYLWSDGITAATDVVLSTGTYWLKVTEYSCSSTDTINVTIIYDTINLLNRDTAICLGGSILASVGANPMATYQWVPTSGIPVSNISNPTITPDTSAEYVVIVRVPGCPPLMDSFFIDVQPNPVVNLHDFRFVCQYDTIHINPDVSPAWYTHYRYSWTPVGDLDYYNLRNAVFTAGSTGEYYLKVTTPAGCVGIDSVHVTVNPGDFLSGQQDIALCPHDSAQITVASALTGTYQWKPSFYLSDSTALNPWVHPVNSQNYRLIGTSAAGCKDTVSVKVRVYASGMISLPDTLEIHPGQSVQILPSSNCTSFTWFPESGLSNKNVADPIASPTASTIYWVNGVTQNGCKVYDSVVIKVNEESTVSVPNAFTPDGTVNRTFKIILDGEAKLNYFRIFDRWGNKVFESTDINAGWDGHYNGKLMPQDAYIYQIQAVTSNGKIITKAGNVTLLR